LLADLHQPGRFLNFYLHPNFGSWMAWGSFFIPLYLLGLIGYAWLCLRPQLADLAKHPSSLAGLYRIAAYGGHDNPSAIRAAALLTALGAALVLLYSGMEVMVVQARSLWNTALLPLIFAATAMTGGIGMTALFEALTDNRQTTPVLNQWLARGVWVTLALLALWLILGLSGTSTAAAEALAAMRGSFGWLATGIWLLGSMLLTLWLARNHQNLLVMPALLALHGAWLIRWIVFIGGQSLPKMGSASQSYTLTLTPDSLLGIVGMAGLCLALYIILTSLIPWDDQAKACGDPS
jgi:tetrathionate reductase subunit C